MPDFCAYCFGPINGKVVKKDGRVYHEGHENRDKPIGSSDLTTAEGVRVGGRGAAYIQKHGLKGS